jgi:hypothetical protein
MKTVVAAFLITAGAFAFEASAKGTPPDTLTACQIEARAGFATAWRLEPSLRAAIDAHRNRMTVACARLAGEKSTAAREACLAEAARGPRHIQRGRNMDRDHVARQKAACRAIA